MFVTLLRFTRSVFILVVVQFLFLHVYTFSFLHVLPLPLRSQFTFTTPRFTFCLLLLHFTFAFSSFAFLRLRLRYRTFFVFARFLPHVQFPFYTVHLYQFTFCSVLHLLRLPACLLPFVGLPHLLHAFLLPSFTFCSFTTVTFAFPFCHTFTFATHLCHARSFTRFTFPRSRLLFAFLPLRVPLPLRLRAFCAVLRSRTHFPVATPPRSPFTFGYRLRVRFNFTFGLILHFSSVAHCPITPRSTFRLLLVLVGSHFSFAFFILPFAQFFTLIVVLLFPPPFTVPHLPFVYFILFCLFVVCCICICLFVVTFILFTTLRFVVVAGCSSFTFLLFVYVCLLLQFQLFTFTFTVILFIWFVLHVATFYFILFYSCSICCLVYLRSFVPVCSVPTFTLFFYLFTFLHLFSLRSFG